MQITSVHPASASDDQFGPVINRVQVVVRRVVLALRFAAQAVVSVFVLSTLAERERGRAALSLRSAKATPEGLPGLHGVTPF
jgi:hypothetical protein